MPTWFWTAAGLAAFAAASFFFAAAESALFALGRWQLRQLEEAQPDGGGVVARLLREPQDLLATIALGNTTANAGIVALAFWMLWQSGWTAAWLILGGVGVFLLLLVGGEVIPKTLAVRSPGRWALGVARPMAWLVDLSRPVRRVAQALNAALLRASVPGSLVPQTGLTDAEYQELVELAFQRGSIAASEKEIILEIIQLDRKTVGDVMRARSQMECISDELSVEEMVDAARRLRHRRLPMYDETPDTIVGVLNTRVLLLHPEADLSEAIEFPSFVPQSMNLLVLLKSLQRQQRGLAIVLDEFGTTAGVVTVEDILEELLGPLRAEEEGGFVMESLGSGRWRVNGTMRLEDFRREYPELGEVAGFDTVGGLVVGRSEVVPAVGDSVQWRGLKFTVAAGDERRVREVLVEAVDRKGGRGT